MPTSPRERVPYSAIIDRPPLPLPAGVRMVVWLIVNVEHWDINRPAPRPLMTAPMGTPLLPDLPNWTWHEYGMRVGFWRIHEALVSRGITASLAINGLACESYPRIASAARDAGWEFLAHGYVQEPMHNLADQAADIRRTLDMIGAFTGKIPRGWESPGLTETHETVDLLARAGIEYVADWVMDDQPFTIRTTSGPLVSVPYTVEMNDVVMMAIGRHDSTEFLARGKRQFDRMYRESQAITRFMSLSVHPFLLGAPHRIGHFEELLDYIQGHSGVAFWTGDQILDWYRSVMPADLPGAAAVAP